MCVTTIANFVNSEESVKEVFDTCENVCEQKIPIKISAKRNGDPAILIANNDKAKETLKKLDK